MAVPERWLREMGLLALVFTFASMYLYLGLAVVPPDRFRTAGLEDCGAVFEARRTDSMMRRDICHPYRREAALERAPVAAVAAVLSVVWIGRSLRVVRRG